MRNINTTLTAQPALYRELETSKHYKVLKRDFSTPVPDKVENMKSDVTTPIFSPILAATTIIDRGAERMSDIARASDFLACLD